MKTRRTKNETETTRLFVLDTKTYFNKEHDDVCEAFYEKHSGKYETRTLHTSDDQVIMTMTGPKSIVNEFGRLCKRISRKTKKDTVIETLRKPLVRSI